MENSRFDIPFLKMFKEPELEFPSHLPLHSEADIHTALQKAIECSTHSTSPAMVFALGPVEGRIYDDASKYESTTTPDEKVPRKKIACSHENAKFLKKASLGDVWRCECGSTFVKQSSHVVIDIA